MSDLRRLSHHSIELSIELASWSSQCAKLLLFVFVL